MLFPDDVNGDVLRRMEASGFNFKLAHNIEYSRCSLHNAKQTSSHAKLSRTAKPKTTSRIFKRGQPKMEHAVDIREANDCHSCAHHRM